MQNAASYLRLGCYVVVCAILPVAMGFTAIGLPLAGLTVILLTAPASSAIIFTLASGVLMESFSPFPAFSYIGALTMTLIALHALSRRYLNNRTIFGAATMGFLSVLFFEIFAFIFSRLFSTPSISGWMPILNRAYLAFFLWRALANVIFVAAVFLILQRSSPRTRGTIIVQHSF